MGIYTDYGRFVKARQFKDWCNAGAGIWFGFGIGSPTWDKIVTDTNGNGRPNVPPSSPNLYSPLYRWFSSVRSEETGTADYVLKPQEMSLLDRSYWGTTQDLYPDDQTVKNEAATNPDENYSPLVEFFSEPHTLLSCDFEIPYLPNDDEYRILFPQVPAFPLSYGNDWADLADNFPSSFDPSNEPTDPEQYESFAYNYHLNYSKTNLSDNKFGAPVGLLAFIQGSAHFVEPIEEEEPSSSSSIENLRKFKYGNHYWRIVQDNGLEDPDGDRKLPHHILLTVSVFPNELAQSSLVERELPVRQVSVFKFPDTMVSSLGLDQTPLPRSSQIIRRDKINMVYSKLDSENLTPSNNSGDSSVKNIPFHGFTPLDPNNSTSPTIEMIINDFMTARKRDVQQTDRYGYIIGF